MPCLLAPAGHGPGPGFLGRVGIYPQRYHTDDLGWRPDCLPACQRAPDGVLRRDRRLAPLLRGLCRGCWTGGQRASPRPPGLGGVALLKGGRSATLLGLGTWIAWVVWSLVARISRTPAWMLYSVGPGLGAGLVGYCFLGNFLDERIGSLDGRVYMAEGESTKRPAPLKSYRGSRALKGLQTELA